MTNEFMVDCGYPRCGCLECGPGIMCPRTRELYDRRMAAWRFGGFVLAALFAAAVLLVIATMQTRAHGPAKWIQDGAYKNAVGELCCGERDCGYFKSGTIVRVDGGYQVDAVFQVEHPTQGPIVFPVKGFVAYEHATPSPTGEYWACSWGGSLKCFFVPPPNS
jgi:hypothetical protein